MHRSLGSLVLCLLLTFPCCVLCQERDETRLANPGFELTPAQTNWEVSVYGATPRIERDTRVLHSGRSSLRISAEMPSDTALGQEIRLHAGRCYRLRGWVRTQGLDPQGAPVYGTFQVQLPHGRSVIASGVNHGDDTAWTEVTVPFLAPSEGAVRICVFFVGFGKGVGAAWFDDLHIEEVKLSMDPITITREPLCTGTISPYQYGQFVEYLCNLVPAMWAEKLYDGSFEGLSPYKVAYLKETDFQEKPWYPCGATNRAAYSLDPASKVSGNVSQKIAADGGAPSTLGIAQDGIAVERGNACRLSLYLRQEAIARPVRVRLHHEGKVYATAEFRPGTGWHKVEARLVPSETDANATLSIEFRGPGTLWIDNASLMSEDTLGGWRRDVVEAARALKPGIIRFGGSALDDSNLGEFQWRDTIGDPDHRRPFRAWGGLQPTGPGLEEIVQFCHAVGAEPLICVRFTGSTPQSAAEEVQYFNGAANTPMGAWRAKNGHPEPYHIKFWQVGNERDGSEYEAGLRAFCLAMRQADPTIKLLSSYPKIGVLHNAGDLLDYICPHQYNCANLGGERHELDETRRMIQKEAPGRNIKVGVTEWNTTGGHFGTQRAMLWSLDNALACARYQNLLHRECDMVEIANRSNLINSFCSGIIQTDNHRLYKTPTYYMQQLYATLGGTRPLKILSGVPAETAPDISATLSADGATLTLFAVNLTSEEIARPLDLSAFGNDAQDAEIWTIADRDHAGEPDVTNSFGDPERIASVRSAFHAPSARFRYTFPAYSITAIRWKVAHTGQQ